MKKIIITVIITFITAMVVSSLPGYLFYAPNQIVMSELFPNAVPPIPDFSYMALGALIFIVFNVIVFDKMGVNNLKSGVITGIWFALLVFSFFDFTLLGIFNILSLEFAMIDIAISGVMGAIQGAVIGWSLGKF
ncbi:MAG: hypothetical protein CMC91_04850 [Flavobacteriaceae bacterium]|nr:hypothetical protein [Flavobacteriaceae bacterium]|tara:strand:+ start:1718 stop:2119 length:402 start_codon:yes stop_codon:yes gene_type:complete